MDTIIGIDLGTTNSEVAYIKNGHAEVIRHSDDGIVPSCVALADDGKVIVGRAALNQAAINPDNTVLSVKRLMGTDKTLKLGNSTFTPQEISAFILKALKERAEVAINGTVEKAVITVPAYFTDAQRKATREAGEIAGLSVVRIINEPTAAALAYESANSGQQTVLIYDLGGGTFDVSIVKIEAGVVEVLASTGDNHLGGDDFDQKIVKHLAAHLESKYQLKSTDDPLLAYRLKRAAESAKIALSTAPFAQIEEDHIGRVLERDVHLSIELSRTDFEEMIAEDLERTMDAVSRALEDAGILPAAVDKIILVGGSTRIPLVAQMLEEKIGIQPHGEIDPDLCVALGAGIQAGREMGLAGSGVLVDITPYTFGTAAIGEVGGRLVADRFFPLIRRNTKLPARRSDVFLTLYDNQEAVEVKVYQGESPDALDNILLGKYMFHLTPSPANSEITLDFDLDLNGILKIQAKEKRTGKKIDAVIENALSDFSQSDLRQTRQRIEEAWQGEAREADEGEKRDGDSAAAAWPQQFSETIEQAQASLESVSDEDRDELVNLIEDLRDALKAQRLDEAETLHQELDDFLFYLG